MLSFFSGYVYQQELPLDGAKKRSRGTRDDNLLMENPRM